MTLTQQSPPLVTQITSCRSCGSGYLTIVLDLGVHAVSDFYSTIPENELRAPLTLAMCDTCGLVQLTHSVAKERLYQTYFYRSGGNEQMVAALKDVVDDVCRHVTLTDKDRVLDIGANDGTLLKNYKQGQRVGIDPALGFVDLSWMRPHDTWIRTFYPPREDWLLSELRPFKVISSCAMFYDLDRPAAFVEAISRDLHREGVWVNQMMDLGAMVSANAFDNICHEHVVYWDGAAFDQLILRHGLENVGISRNDVNGGSLRLMTRHGNRPSFPRSFVPPCDLTSFAHRLSLLKEECLSFLQAAKAHGKTVLGLGASTKFNTLLQYYGITPDLLPFIMERNPDKVGKVTAGSHIPIISEEEGRARNPDYFLIGPWHFLEGLKEREAAYLRRGGKFVVPLPELRVIGI